MAKDSNTYKIKIPTIESFEMEYYIQNQSSVQSARVFPPHLHDDLELYILLDGDASFMVEKNLYKLSAGDAIVSKPNEMHNCILNTVSVHKHLCFWFEASSSFLFSAFFKQGFGSGNLISPSQENKRKLLQIYKELNEAGKNEQTHRQVYLVLEILDIFSRSITPDENALTLPEKLRDILDDIDKNFPEINSLNYFTQKYFVSQSTLHRLFRQYLNTSPKMYLETKRLAYSRILLKEGKSVFDACMIAGFPDYSNYIRLFKTRFGVTPKQYRDSKN